MGEESETIKLLRIMLNQDQSAGARAEQAVSELRGQFLQIQKQMLSKKEEKELTFSGVLIGGLDAILKDKNSRIALLVGATFFCTSGFIGLLWLIDRHPSAAEKIFIFFVG